MCVQQVLTFPDGLPERTQAYVRVNGWPFYLSWILSFGIVIALSCSDRLRKQYPINYLFLVRLGASFHQDPTGTVGSVLPCQKEAASIWV